MNSIKSEIWTLTREEVLARFHSDWRFGLASEQVEKSRRQNPLKPIPSATKQSALKILVRQFTDFMTLMLLAAAAISSTLGHVTDGIAIAAVLVLNGIIGFVQESRAEKAIESLKSLASPTAKVIRNGEPIVVPPEELVLGDVMVISTGELVPADGILLECTNLHTDESTLTGESLPVEKRLEPSSHSAALAERHNMVFSGTLTTSGHGLALVTAIGIETQLGQIANLLSRVVQQQTPLQKRLRSLSMHLTWLAVLICLVIATMYVARGLLRDEQINWIELLFASIGLAVAAIPEGLPAAITISLALGAQRMASRKAIVRQLASVETLGAVSVICTDKTGTLTQNRMSVAFSKAANGDHTTKELCAKVAVLCNNAKLDRHNNAHGSATEAAILRDAIIDHPERKQWTHEWPRIKEFPFTSDRKCMSTIHLIEGKTMLLCKGAVEMVLAKCTANHESQPTVAAEYLKNTTAETSELADRGFRVLGYAQRVLTAGWENAAPETLEKDLTFLGFVALQDPLRPEATAAIGECHEAGVKVIMLTGDHAGTARHIANDLALGGDKQAVLTGADIDKMNTNDLKHALRSQRVFARVTPANKLAIVNALIDDGEIVAMTGDGVNDAPALKQADVGVAMGINGTEVSKQAAKIVLADDNFATIVAAIEEGRLVYANIQKFIRYLLTGNLSEVLTIFFSVVVGMPVPLLPIHLLWINLVTDGIPALAIAFSPASENLMRKPPRKQDASLLNTRQITGVVFNGAIFAALCLGTFAYMISQSTTISYARTAVLFAIAQLQLIYSLTFTNSSGFFGGKKLFRNYRLWTAVIVSEIAQLLIVYVPTFQVFFATEALSLADVTKIIFLALFAAVLASALARENRLG